MTDPSFTLDDLIGLAERTRIAALNDLERLGERMAGGYSPPVLREPDNRPGCSRHGVSNRTPGSPPDPPPPPAGPCGPAS